MFFFILLQLDDNSIEDTLYNELEQVDVNTASRQDLLSIPFLTDAEVDSIIRYRPFSSVEEIARLLHLSPIETRILGRYIILSHIDTSKKSDRNNRWYISTWTTVWADTAWSWGVRYLLQGGWGEWRGRFRGRGDTVTFILSGAGLYFGNFRIAYSSGLLGSSYLRASSGISIRSYRSLSLMFNRRGFTGLVDSSGNFLLFYRRKMGAVEPWVGFVGNGKVGLYGGIDLGLLGGEVVFRDGISGYGYYVRFNAPMVYARIIYRRVMESFWSYADTGIYFSAYSRLRMGPFTFRGYLSNRYYYQTVSYRVSSSASMEMRVSSSSYRISFRNREPLEASWIHGRCGDAISLRYRFFRVIYYDTHCSMYVYGSYIPLMGTGISLKGKGVAYIINLNLKGIRIRYMGGKLSVSYGWSSKW